MISLEPILCVRICNAGGAYFPGEASVFMTFDHHGLSAITFVRSADWSFTLQQLDVMHLQTASSSFKLCTGLVTVQSLLPETLLGLSVALLSQDRRRVCLKVSRGRR